jgi:hypothetical protein
MARPVTLFTGQWADLPFETACQKAKSFGYDGIELPCWGDHFDVVQALKDPGYVKTRWEILRSHGLTSFAISNHLVGQAVCDLIDERHKSILPDDVWGDGEPEGVRKRAAQRMIDTAKAARLLRDAAPEKIDFPMVVNGFTGSSIWHSIYAFPPTSQAYWQKGFDDFANRWTPILNEFDKARRELRAGGPPDRDRVRHRQHPAGDRRDQGAQAVRVQLRPVAPRVPGRRLREVHLHVRQADLPLPREGRVVGQGDRRGRRVRRAHDVRRPPAVLGLPLARATATSTSSGSSVALNDVGYQGPLSVEWEDSRMDREFGAAEACAMVKRIDFKPSSIAFDAQFDR